MRLHLVQNIPFTPMVDAWEQGADTVEPMNRGEVLRRLERTVTSVLANSSPPYAVAGGVRNVLEESGGEMYGVTNEEILQEQKRIAAYHGFEPFPEAGAAFAGLVQAVEAGRIGAEDSVLVHVTGAGSMRSVVELGRRRYPVSHLLDPDDEEGATRAVGVYLDRLD